MGPPESVFSRVLKYQPLGVTRYIRYIRGPLRASAQGFSMFRVSSGCSVSSFGSWGFFLDFSDL